MTQKLFKSECFENFPASIDENVDNCHAGSKEDTIVRDVLLTNMLDGEIHGEYRERKLNQKEHSHFEHFKNWEFRAKQIVVVKDKFERDCRKNTERTAKLNADKGRQIKSC